MPYITQKEREELNVIIQAIEDNLSKIDHPGKLNYLMTVMAHAFVKKKGINYANLNEVVGVFESAKAEFQRRMVAPYEDEKIRMNGDV